MFTVMGITGNVGGAVAENLLAAGKKVRGVVRNAEKAKAWADKDVELVQSAYDDPAALASAFTGAEGVFAMIPPDFAPAPGLPDQKRTIAAIRKALEQAKPGKAAEVEAFLKQGAEMAKAEPGTVTWYGLKEDDGLYSVFDTFEDEAGREAHLNGDIAKALMAKASELFAEAPKIHKISVVAAK